jgi:DNA repair exonuclease SbcCD nuclease subunit
MVQFLHTADWQIGRQYGRLNEDGAFLAEARFDAVATIASLAARRNVDAVLVAGDVFDMQDVSDRTIRRLFQLLEGFAGPWVLIAGNHDAALNPGVWTRAQALRCVPPNVHLPQSSQALEFPDIGLAVLAAPLTQRHTHDDVTLAFDGMVTSPGLVRVGLAHGSVSGMLPDSIDSANPIAPDRAVRAGLDYLALGDWHGCLQINDRTWYAGTPEQDRFRGNEPGYALCVRIGRPGAVPDVERIRTGRFRWHDWHERIGLPGDIEALVERLGRLDADDVLQLVVEGQASGAGHRALEEAVGRAEARVRALRWTAEALLLEPDEEDLGGLGKKTYLSEVAGMLQDLQQDPERGDVAREAMRLLIRLQAEVDRCPEGGR